MTEQEREPSERNALDRLRAAKGFVFDMDGVLYRGDHQLPGVVDLINGLVIRDIPYMLATNNSMATPAMYVAKLAKMGIDTQPEHILTSATATRLYIDEHLSHDAGVYVVGMSPLRDQLFSGSTKRFSEGDPTIEAVVVGLDLEFTYAKLKMANGA